MKTKTYCPLFPGFYDTYFSLNLDNAIDCIDKTRVKNGLKPIDDYHLLKVDEDGYQKDIALKYCSLIEGYLKELNIQCSIEFESIWSPREYNFESDSINCTIEINNPLHIVHLVNQRFNEWAEYLKENFTSRDGFISHYSNSANSGDWSDIMDALKHPTKCGVILEFLLQGDIDEIKNIVPDNLQVYEGNYILNFNELLTLVTKSDIEDRVNEFEHSLWLEGGRIFSTFSGGIECIFGELNGSFFKAIYNDENELVFCQKYEGSELAEKLYSKVVAH